MSKLGPLAQVHMRLERLVPEWNDTDRRAFVCGGLLGLNRIVETLTELPLPEVQRLIKALCIPDRVLLERIAEWREAREREQVSLTDLLEVAEEFPDMPECFAEAALEYRQQVTPAPIKTELTPPATDAEVLLEILMGYCKHLTEQGKEMRREALQKMNWFELQYNARNYCQGKPWQDFETKRAVARAWELLGVDQEEMFV